MPAYAGLISSMGFAFLLETTYLLPLTALFLGVAVGMLAFRADRRRGFGPFAVGAVAAATLLVSKFLLDWIVGVYIGAAMLIAASVWNIWPKRAQGNSVAPPEMLYHIGSSESEV